MSMACAVPPSTTLGEPLIVGNDDVRAYLGASIRVEGQRNKYPANTRNLA
jgi:hypothetical protein